LENEMHFVDACALATIAPGKARTVRVENRSLALFNVEGEIHALDDSCPHAGSSLASGELCGRRVKCRAHGWRFDVVTGELIVSPSIKVARHQVRIDGDRIQVAISV
jgi:naphthalene 1,2-dioxygenase ferredoxin component